MASLEKRLVSLGVFMEGEVLSWRDEDRKKEKGNMFIINKYKCVPFLFLGYSCQKLPQPSRNCEKEKKKKRLRLWPR